MTESTTFWQYIKGNVPNHIKLFGSIALIISSVIGFNYVRDLRTQLRNQLQIAATLSQKLQIVGSSAVAANSQGTVTSVNQQAAAAFPPELVALMKQQGAQIQSLTAATAQTASQISSIQAALPNFAPTTHAATGILTGYSLEQNRDGKPALTSLNLFYDPSQPDPSKAFAKTTWNNYQETFGATVGDWQKQSDGGLKTSVSVIRTVMKPDPSNPGKMVAVGTENIPLISASTVYVPKALVANIPGVTSRWTASAGISTDSIMNNSTSNFQPAGLLDYRVTTNIGIFTGVVNKSLVGGLSYRIGGRK